MKSLLAPTVRRPSIPRLQRPQSRYEGLRAFFVMFGGGWLHRNRKVVSLRNGVECLNAKLNVGNEKEERSKK